MANKLTPPAPQRQVEISALDSSPIDDCLVNQWSVAKRTALEKRHRCAKIQSITETRN
jgi:hypothetical protein